MKLLQRFQVERVRGTAVPRARLTNADGARVPPEWTDTLRGGLLPHKPFNSRGHVLGHFKLREMALGF